MSKLSEEITNNLKVAIKEVFGEDLYSILLYGSSLSARKVPNDIDIIIILKGLEDLSKLEKFKAEIKNIPLVIDAQVISLKEVTEFGFSHDTHGEFVIDFLKSAKVLYGENPFLNLQVKYIDKIISVRQKLQYYYFRAKKLFVNNENLDVKDWKFHKKKITLMLFDFYLLLSGVAISDIKDEGFNNFLNKNFPDLKSILLQDDFIMGSYEDILSLYKKVYYSMLEKLTINNKKEIKIIDGIYLEYYKNNKNKLAIVCSGLPTDYNEENIISYLQVMGYDVLIMHYRSTGLSSSSVFDPVSDVECIVNKSVQEYEIVDLFANSFGASLALKISDSSFSVLNKVFLISPAFDLSKVVGIETLPKFIVEERGYMYHFSEQAFSNYIKSDHDIFSIDKDMSKVFVIHGSLEEKIPIKYIENMQKKYKFNLFKVDAGHMSFNRFLRSHLDSLYKLL